MARTVAAYVHNMIRPVVEGWFVRQCHDPALRMYVYYLPTDTVNPGAFCISAESPGGDWKIVTATAVRTDFTKEHIQSWIYELSRNLPILPYELDLAA